MEKRFRLPFKWNIKTFIFLVFLRGFVPIMLSFFLFPFTLGSATICFVKQDKQPEKKIFPQNYFVVPTDSFLNIAGNFGELRPNHFHAGLDIKTGGREGVHVLASGDGYISRVKISPTGYGKCLYITHPNGFVTVYGHLQRFYGKIADYIRSIQYYKQNFEIDTLIPAGILKVKQCDTIALSGNTGGSQGAHLHFEIRDAVTEHAYNPLLFGFKIDDNSPPSISALKVYAATDSSSINGKNQSYKVGVFGSKGTYHIPAEKITVHGPTGFGIEATDYAAVRAAGKFGVYSIELLVDDKKIYYHELNEISFDESRYINSLVDYAEEERHHKLIQKCFRDENNMLSIYQCVVNDGLYDFNDALPHSVKFIVKDFFGNASTIQFSVQSSEKKPKMLPVADTRHLMKMKCSEENKFETPDVKISIPPCTLYSDIDFNYSKEKDTLKGALSPVHVVNSEEVPLHNNCTISIKMKNVREKYRDKAVVVSLDEKNSRKVFPSKIDPANPSWVTAQTRYFGRFTVVLDTVAPFIKPYNIYNGKNLKYAKTLAVIIGDNLSGVESYRATVDGKWILMDYEPKKSMLFYEFDSRDEITPGRHTFEVTVKDVKGNANTYKATFIR
ncbi:MAG TPA: M23 family metallopeptidase [Bacteroidia bacterium]